MIGAIITGLRAIVSWMRDLPSRAKDALGDLGSYLYRSGQALLKGFISGITSMLKPVKNAVSTVLSGARGLFPFSPAKEGPFAGKGWTLYSGMSIGQALSAGMASQIAGVRRSASALASAAQGELVTPGSPTAALVSAPRRPAAGPGGYGAYGGGIVKGSVDVNLKLLGTMDKLMTALRESISISGGDVQMVLGQG
jgi:hypothetical protein